jgi:Protein of unknown function (DUF3096)
VGEPKSPRDEQLWRDLQLLLELLRSEVRKEVSMVLEIGHITPLVSLIAGILILILPSLLNYVVAIYLILVGILGLNDIYHFLH